MSFIRRPLIAAAVIATLPTLALAQAGQVIGPGGSSSLGNTNPWHPSVQGGAQIEVTKNNPRVGWGGYGSGSLEMSVTGQGAYPAGFNDWGFWYQWAGGTEANRYTAAYGDLRQLSSLSFDWYRTGLAGWNDEPGSHPNSTAQNPVNPVDWRYKTPVMRLRLLETDNAGNKYDSELIWEGYYNQCALGSNTNCADNWTVVDNWNTQSNMQLGNFWYARPSASGSPSYLLGDKCTPGSMTLWAGAQGFNGLNELLSGNGCLANLQNISVIGIAVGVGSQWPLPYHGFVDNVRMGFRGQDGLAVDANYDFIPNTTVPEPSTYALMGAGLLALGAAARKRNRKQ
jgi:hypothetical protein